jgi:uncharacterized protein (TIGR02466 family)
MIRWQGTDGSGQLISTAIKLELARRAVASRPDSAPVHYALAAECFRVQDFAAGIAAFEHGARLAPPEPDNLGDYIEALLATDRVLEALDVLDKYSDREAHSVGLLVQRAEVLRRIGRLDAATAALRQALALRPDDLGAAVALQSLLSSRKDWAGLLNFAEQQAQRNALTMPAIVARLGGLIGLGREAEAARLLDFDTLVGVSTIAPPPGFESLTAFNTALAHDIMSARKIRLSNVPRLAMTGGVQVEDLETDSSPAMSALFGVLRTAVEDYLAERKNACPDIIHAIAPGAAHLEAWALVLGPGDTQDRHFHIRSSVAGVYYVAAPDELLAQGAQEGCLEIPCIGTETMKSLVRPRFVQPMPGRLVLFPGYIPHRTTPMQCASNRLSIAFDVVPEYAKVVSREAPG